MTIGELIKEYRISQLKKQKEFTGNIISPSYYSKVEKNIHRITAEDLINLLHYNNIPLWEFFSRLNQNDTTMYTQVKELNSLMLNKYYSKDTKGLKELEKLINVSNLSDKEKETQKLLVAGWLESMKKANEKSDEKLREKLKDQIFNIPNFNKNKIILFCNYMTFYDLPSVKVISRQILSQYKTSTDTQIQIALIAIIENILALSIEYKAENDIADFLSSADNIPTNPELFFYKNGFILFKNIVEYHVDKDPSHLVKCQTAIDTFRNLGMTTYSNTLQKFFLKYK